MRRVSFVLFLACVFAAGGAAAQERAAVAPGARVRVYVSTRYNSAEVAGASGYHYGNVQAIDSSAVTLKEENGTEFRIPFSSIRQIDVSRGAAAPGEGTRIGARKGALVGAGVAVGALGILYGVTKAGDLLQKDQCPVELGECDFSSGPPGRGLLRPTWGNAGKLAVIGGVVGSLLGTVIGSAGHERWEGVRLRTLRLQLAPAAEGGTSVSLRL